MNIKSFKKLDWLILLFILFLGLIFRLYKINTPLADLHSWRQVDTAAVSRNFIREGFDLLHPRYDDLSDIETGKPNPQGWRFVEFPLYNAMFAFTYQLLPKLPLEVHGRLLTASFSLVIISIIYYFSLKESGRVAAIFASLVYAVFPFFVFFSRVVLPETNAVALSFLSLIFLYWYCQKKAIDIKKLFFLCLSATFFALSLLVKPTTIFYSLAIIYLFFKRYGWQLVRKADIYLFFIISFSPLIAWRFYITQYPEGIPANDWLLTSVNTYQGLKNIFFRPAFFRWIFFERINNMIFGGYLTFLFILGVLKKNKSFFLHLLLFCAFVYLFVFEGGNVQHEYYQTIVLPTLAIFVGLGSEFVLLLRKNIINRFFTFGILIAIIILGFSFSYYKTKGFYDYPDDLVNIASVIKTLTKPNDKIITDRSGDTTLLYLSDRKGWPAYTGNLDKLKNEGYRFFITGNKHLIMELKKSKNYQLIFENDQFTIFAL